MTTRSELILTGIDKFSEYVSDKLKGTTFEKSLSELRQKELYLITLWLAKEIYVLKDDVEAGLESLMKKYNIPEDLIQQLDKGKLHNFIRYFIEVLED